MFKEYISALGYKDGLSRDDIEGIVEKLKNPEMAELARGKAPGKLIDNSKYFRKLNENESFEQECIIRLSLGGRNGLYAFPFNSKDFCGPPPECEGEADLNDIWKYIKEEDRNTDSMYLG